jgi:L-asparagine transporter-like permease
MLRVIGDRQHNIIIVAHHSQREAQNKRRQNKLKHIATYATGQPLFLLLLFNCLLVILLCHHGWRAVLCVVVFWREEQ